MAYYTPSDLKRILTEENVFADIKKIIDYDNYFEDANFKCYVFSYNNTIFISLNSQLLYKNNKHLDKLKDNIYIHSGLLQQYKSIEDVLAGHIDALANASTKKIYITGYYMGAGLATIAAAILAEKYKNMYLVSCFTFASPKVGNKQFKEYFKDNVTCNYRVVVNDKIDLISSVNTYNHFNYLKHHCGLYSHFVDRGYYHVSNAFLLEDNNIFEFPLPKLSRTEKVFMRCNYSNQCSSCCTNYLDELVDVDVYIKRFSSIIAKYKTNLLQKQKSLMTATITDPSKYFETFAISQSSDRSNGSDTSSSPPSVKTPATPASVNTPATPAASPEYVKKEDLLLLQQRFDKILSQLNNVNHNMSCI